MSQYSEFISNQGNIYPVVRRPASLDISLTKPFVGGLEIRFAVDKGNMVTFLNPEGVPPNVTVDHLLALACGNLMNNLGNFHYQDIGHGVNCLITPDDPSYAISYLLADKFMDAITKKVGENIVFSIPHSSRVLFIGQSQRDVLPQFFMLARQEYEDAQKKVFENLLLYNKKSKKFSVIDENSIMKYLK